jgi:hypothetical protein
LERHRGGECHREYAAALTHQVIPADPHLVRRKRGDFGGRLLLAQHEIVAPIRQRRVQPERNAQFGAPFDGPMGGLVFQSGEGAGLGIEGREQRSVLQDDFGREGAGAKNGGKAGKSEGANEGHGGKTGEARVDLNRFKRADCEGKPEAAMAVKSCFENGIKR